MPPTPPTSAPLRLHTLHTPSPTAAPAAAPSAITQTHPQLLRKKALPVLSNHLPGTAPVRIARPIASCSAFSPRYIVPEPSHLPPSPPRSRSTIPAPAAPAASSSHYKHYEDTASNSPIPTTPACSTQNASATGTQAGHTGHRRRRTRRGAFSIASSAKILLQDLPHHPRHLLPGLKRARRRFGLHQLPLRKRPRHRLPSNKARSTINVTKSSFNSSVGPISQYCSCPSSSPPESGSAATSHRFRSANQETAAALPPDALLRRILRRQRAQPSSLPKIHERRIRHDLHIEPLHRERIPADRQNPTAQSHPDETADHLPRPDANDVNACALNFRCSIPESAQQRQRPLPHHPSPGSSSA